jgi:protocatechuate 3,4-dioxygenase beta subunit
MRTFLLLLIATQTLAAGVQAQRARVAPATAASVARIAPEQEPGLPLSIEGTVVDAARKALAGVSIYVFQTDARGYYAQNTGRPEDVSRIHGYLRTDPSGKFKITTIRPGHYPNSTIPQHVHLLLKADGQPERAVEIVFSDDARITERVRADAAKERPFYFICSPRVVNGTTHCNVTFVL